MSAAGAKPDVPRTWLELRFLAKSCLETERQCSPAQSLETLVGCSVVIGFPFPFPFDLLSEATLLSGYELNNERVRIPFELPEKLSALLHDRRTRATPAPGAEAPHEFP